MENVITFINALGENYYYSFIIKSDEEVIDFSRYNLKVFYNNDYYYELNINEIHLKRREIINNIRELYQKAISDIYINLSVRDSEYLESFLHFNLEAAKFKLKIIRNDFYIDSNLSRYFSEIDTNSNIAKILSLYVFKYSKESGIEIDDEVLSKIKENISYNDYEIEFLLKFYYERYSSISFIPMSLFVIGNQFVFELNKIRAKIESIKENKFENSKIIWSGTKTHIGFIMGNLAQNGYLEPPRNKNGEINYTAFAKLIKHNFEVEISDDTLRKYLNPLEDKFIENKKIFDKENFCLPHNRLIS